MMMIRDRAIYSFRFLYSVPLAFELRRPMQLIPAIELESRVSDIIWNSLNNSFSARVIPKTDDHLRDKQKLNPALVNKEGSHKGATTMKK